MKSTSIPSTPQADQNNVPSESRLSLSLQTESCPSADLLSDAREEKETREENIFDPETPLVSM